MQLTVFLNEESLVSVWNIYRYVLMHARQNQQY